MPRLVAIGLPGGNDFVDEVRRAWDRGDAVLPVDHRLPDVAKDAVVRAMRPHVVVDLDGRRNLSDGIDTEIDDALVIATSGSTGQPKGVVHTMRGLEASARSTSTALGTLESDSWLACLPLAHIGGFSVVARALIMGLALEVHDGFDAYRVGESECTLTSLVPTALRRLDPSRFRRILLGGSRPPADRPHNCVATYGLTETGSGVVYDGWPNPDVELRILEDEILVRGPMLMRAYRDGTTTIDADGWLHTDDVGRLTSDGRLEVEGRRGDVINTGGQKVWPDAVEKVLQRLLPDVDLVIVSRPDPEWGERVVLVHTGGAPDLATCRSMVKESLAAYCAPTDIVAVTELPRTSSGKVRRDAVRRIIADSASRGDD